jgi:hypothetical protein
VWKRRDVRVRTVSIGRAAVALGWSLLTGSCQFDGQCVDPDTRPALSSYSGACTSDDNCVVTGNYVACGGDCNCDVVVAVSERERFERDWGQELCCSPEETNRDCDCGNAHARCIDNVCGNGPP